MIDGSYAPLRKSSTTQRLVCGLPYQFREWGDPSSPLLLFLHGHRDCSASFQFLVDQLAGDWHVVAPDWRGHGSSAWSPQGYFFEDYLLDLDQIIELVSPNSPVRVLGHSLGGNVAGVYAGVRPKRIAMLASLDGFGLKGHRAADMPDHLCKWLDSWRVVPKPRTYPDLPAMADRLMAANKRLPRDRALYLASHMARNVDDGLSWSFDPGHQRPFGTLHRLDAWAACWERIEAPTLCIAAGDRFERMPRRGAEGFDWRLSHFKTGAMIQIPGTGHNIHHDRPDEAARVVEAFFLSDEGKQAS